MRALRYRPIATHVMYISPSYNVRISLNYKRGRAQELTAILPTLMSEAVPPSKVVVCTVIAAELGVRSELEVSPLRMGRIVAGEARFYTSTRINFLCKGAMSPIL